MLDIVRDYTAIGVGTAQAATARVAGLGREAAWLATDPSTLTLLDPRTRIATARTVVGQMLAGDVEAVISQIGLAKKSELTAVRMQLQRLERRLSETRGER